MGNRHQMLLFLSSFLLLVSVRTQAQESQPNITGYTCSSGPSPCQTYAVYRAQAPDFLDLQNISQLFRGVLSSNIAKASGLPTNTLPLVDGQPLLVPITCGCMSSYSQANISYTIVKDDTFSKVSSTKFENLTTYQAVEAANPSKVVTDLQIGDNVTIPIRCKCPTAAQLASGTKMLITYVVGQGETLSSISQKFSTDRQSLKSLNGVNTTLDPFSTVLVPVSKLPQFAQVPSSSPSPSPSSSPPSPPSPPSPSPFPSPSPTATSPSPSPSPTATTPPTSATPPPASSITSPPPSKSESGLHRGALLGASLGVARSLVCIAFFVFWMF